MRARKFIASLVLSAALAVGALPSAAFADDALGDVDSPRTPTATTTATSSAADSVSDESASDAEATTDGVEVSREGSAALKDGASFAIGDFSRAQKGSNRAIDGTYYGYSYLVGQEEGSFAQVVAADKYVVAYIPAAAAAKLGLDAQSVSDQAQLKSYFAALDEGQAMGRPSSPSTTRGTSQATRYSTKMAFASRLTRSSEVTFMQASSASMGLTSPTRRAPSI